MAGPIKLKLGGMIKGMGENVLAKEFFGSVEVDRGQVSGPQVPLLGRGDDRDPKLGTQTPASLGGMSHPLLPLS